MKFSVRQLSYSRLLVITSFLLWMPLIALAAEPIASEPTSEKIDVVFVLDNSGSMRENDPEFLTREAVGNFASALAMEPRIDGRIGVVLFDGQARLLQALTPIDGDDTDSILASSMTELDFSGQRTNSPAGIERALYEFRQNGRADARQAIVLLTDGKIDTGNAQSDLEAARWLREDLAGESETSKIRIFGIAFTDAADYQLMQALARRTNAEYYRAFEASELSRVVDKVLLKIAEAEPSELVAEEQAAPEVIPADDSASPDVAAAPLSQAEQSNFGLLGILPAAILLVAGSLVWRRQSKIGSATGAVHAPAQDAHAPPAQLLDVAGHLGEAGSSIDLARTRTRIGRDTHNELVIEDDTISAEHAFIDVRNGRYWLEDRRSTNGTRLNEERLAANTPTQLKGGDHIHVAEIALKFMLTGYVPAGETVYLSSAARPPADWRASVDTVAPAEPVERDVERSVPAIEHDIENPFQAATSESPAEALEPEFDFDPETEPITSDTGPGSHEVGMVADVEEAQGFEAAREAEAVSSPELESPQTPELDREPEPVPEPDQEQEQNETGAYRDCLDYHLERVSEISPAFASFIGDAFRDEIRGALCVSARDLAEDARNTGEVQQKAYTFERVRFVVCGVPGEIESARDFYVQTFGGFTCMLSEQLQSDAFRIDVCETLAVLTFGSGDAPWVSLSIVPDEEKDPRIDLLSYEFLTEGERRELEPSEHTDLSQSGLG